jgi:hypothetical protein
MRRAKKILLISLGCGVVVVVLMLTAVLSIRLLANREFVKTYIVSETARLTGAELDYGRLALEILPLPHLVARDIHLRRTNGLTIGARQLSLFPSIRTMLAGRFKIRHLILLSPAARIRMPSARGKATSPSGIHENGLPSAVVGKALTHLFGALAAVEPGARLEIEKGKATLEFADAPDIHINGIDAAVENDEGDLSLDLDCTSRLVGELRFSATADTAAKRADGKIFLSGLNLRPLLFYLFPPDGIQTADTRAAIDIDFNIDGLDKMQGRFGFKAPWLTVMRKGQSLELAGVQLSGKMQYTKERLSLSVDTLKTQRPSLNLSAAATLEDNGPNAEPSLSLSAAARQLDVAVAATAARAIAGDLRGVRTAFKVVKTGRVADATYFAGLARDESGWRLTRMKAAGNLSRARIAIPGIDSDIEKLAGKLAYENDRVAIKNAEGFFEGATFHHLNAAIDWAKTPALSISTPSVDVDAAVFYDWLTAFKGLSHWKDQIASLSGSARLSKLQIDGPIAQPQRWAISIVATPQAISVASPRLPFKIGLSGGRITYMPGRQQVENVTTTFLDGAFKVAVASTNIAAAASNWKIDGSMGQAAVDWLSKRLPIPRHLEIKPPVDFSNIDLVWTPPGRFLLTGALKTAGGVVIDADIARSPETLQIRRLDFSDGHSKATLSLRRQDSNVDFSFAGNVDKLTADRLLSDNRILTGGLQGDFRARIDTAAPLNSSITGRLAGSGLHISGLTAAPLDIQAFAINGYGRRLKIAPSHFAIGGSKMSLDGRVKLQGNDLIFDTNVKAHQLDEEVLHAFQPAEKGKGNAEGKARSWTITPRGIIHLQAAEVDYGGYTWSPVAADILVNGRSTQVQVNRANLCGLSTTGELDFSPRGIGLHIIPTAAGVDLQTSTACLLHRKLSANARYDLSGQLRAPPTHGDFVRSLTGRLAVSSQNGRIHYANILMKIFSILNITEVFTGGKSDLAENGFGYTQASATALIKNGKVELKEILLDGDSLKLTGQGVINLVKRTLDINLLAAPLKTVDRIVNKIPIINYITAGSLISIPLRVHGRLTDPSVVPIPPTAVGKGLLNIMERTLKAPFKLVQSAAKLTTEKSAGSGTPTGAPPAGRH